MPMASANNLGAVLASYPVNVALDANIFVKLSAGALVACAAADTNGISWTSRKTFAAGDRVSVIPKNTTGSVLATASAAIAQSAVVNQAAAGKMQDSGGGTIRRGVALSAAAADGDWFELLPD